MHDFIQFWIPLLFFKQNRTIEETDKMDMILASMLRTVLLRVQQLQQGEKITTVAASMLVIGLEISIFNQSIRTIEKLS